MVLFNFFFFLILFHIKKKKKKDLGVMKPVAYEKTTTIIQ
jgi:hypothetical protein